MTNTRGTLSKSVAIDENYHNKNYEFYNFNKSESSFDRNRPKIKRKKILVLGAPGVGKSAVIMRFTDDVFKQDYIPTLQETYKKEFAFNNEKVELELNDLDGQNELAIARQCITAAVMTQN